MDTFILTDTEPQPIPLHQIEEDETLSPRLGLSKAEIQRLAQIAREGGPATFRPVVLAGPREDGAYVVLDGRYRLAAAHRAGWSALSAIVRPWTSRRELFAVAVQLAAQHGKQMTRKEKRRAVYQLLLDFPETELSTRKLAEIVGVRHNLVAECRRELQNGGVPGEAPCPTRTAAQYAKGALRELGRLAATIDGPTRSERMGEVLAAAAAVVYADSSPVAELALLADAVRSAYEQVLVETIAAATVAEGGHADFSTADAPAPRPLTGPGPARVSFNDNAGAGAPRPPDFTPSLFTGARDTSIGE